MEDDLAIDRAGTVARYIDGHAARSAADARGVLQQWDAGLLGLPSRVAERIWQHRAAILLVVSFALFLALAVTVVDSARARSIAASVQQDAMRAQAINDFVTRMLEGQSTPTSLTLRLDQHTPLIAKAFRADVAAQMELLTLAATMHRAMGNEGRYQSMRLQQAQLILAGNVDADSAGGFAQSLIFDAGVASIAGSPGAALGYLKQADQLIKHADLEQSILRANWWLANAKILRASQGMEPEVLAARIQAAQLFERHAPQSAAYAVLLDELAWSQMTNAPNQAAIHFRKLLELPIARTVELQKLLRERSYLGLAQVSEILGRYADALTAYEEGAKLLPKLDPYSSSADTLLTSQYAGALHRLGNSAAAMDLFEEINNLQATAAMALPALRPQRAKLQREYAQRLMAEGQVDAALKLLDPEITAASVSIDREAQLLRVQALRLSGQYRLAQNAIKALLPDLLLQTLGDDEYLQRLRLQWGELLLEGPKPELSSTVFAALIDHANGALTETLILAYAGMAELAQRLENAEEMLRYTTLAVVGFENMKGPRDLRSGPRIWLLHASALRQAGDSMVARVWAERALRTSQQIDSHGASSIEAARTELSATRES